MSYIGGNELILNTDANGVITGGGFDISSIASSLGIATFNTVQSGGSLNSVGDLFRGGIVVPCGLLYQRGGGENHRLRQHEVDSEDDDSEDDVIEDSLHDKLLELANPIQKSKKGTRRKGIKGNIGKTKRLTKRR